MRILAFEPAHLDRLVLQEAQAYMGAFVTEEYAAALTQHPSFTATADDVVLGCGGILPLWPGRAQAWAMLSPLLGRFMPALHRRVEFFLDTCGFRRVEATVDCDFAAGHRWVRLLGFELEAERMAAYRPDGADCALYARVRHGN